MDLDWWNGRNSFQESRIRRRGRARLSAKDEQRPTDSMIRMAKVLVYVWSQDPRRHIGWLSAG